MREKKQWSKKLFAGVLCLSLVFTGFGGTAFAGDVNDGSANSEDVGQIVVNLSSPVSEEDFESAQETEGDAVLNLQEETTELEYVEDPFDYTSEEARIELLEESASFPETYDLRDVDGRCYVTPVKLQHPFGTCWGFGAISAAEISILGSLLKDDPDAWKTLNLSEKQLAYFVATALDDPTDPQNGEGTVQTDRSKMSNIYTGGSTFLAANTFAQGIGPVVEDEEVLIYKGKNGFTDQWLIDGRFQNFRYSAEDDWLIPESERFRQTYVLKEAFLLPSPAQKDSVTNEYTYNPAGTAAIKEQLMQQRGVEIAFTADSSLPSQDPGGEGLFINDKWSHYTYDTSTSPNHAVCIVGWDDNYPKENFIEEHQPPANGAWLVKNSWGSGEEEFPNKGYGSWGIQVPKKDAEGNPVLDENGEQVMVGSGYFWLSYYDTSLSAPEALLFDEKNEDTYYLDEHDHMPVSNVSSVTADSVMKIANVFTAEGCESLMAVSSETTTPGTKVTYEVYLLGGKFDSPEDGYLVASGEDTYEYGGFHKYILSDPVTIQKGQSYAIVETMELDNGKYSINVSTGFGEATKVITGHWQVGVINERESFVYKDGSWLDYSDKDLQKQLYENQEHVKMNLVAFDNFPIKGYCEPLSKNISIVTGGDSTSLFMYPGKESAKVSLAFTGSADQELGMPDITWKLAEGGESIADMQLTQNNTVAELTAKAPGKTQLIITVDGVGTTVVPVTVGYPVLTAILMSGSTEFTYTGKPLTVNASASSSIGLLAGEGMDKYELRYTNNIKCGLASVEAHGTGAMKDPEDMTNLKRYFVITPAQAALQELKASETGLTVTVEDQQNTGITGYQVEYRMQGTSNWTAKYLAAGKNQLTLSGLKAGKKYEVRVSGYVKANSLIQETLLGTIISQKLGTEKNYYGAASSTKTSDLIKPQKAAIKKIATGKNKLQVTVKNQKTTGITGYQIQYRVKGTGKWQSETLKSGKTKCTIKKLQKGKKYQVRVRGFVKVSGKTTYGAFSKVKLSAAVK